MTTKRRRWLGIGFLLIVILAWGMGQYDYARLVGGKLPMFARVTLHLKDGGSVQYLGLGYTVTEEHEMRWGIEIPTEARMKDSSQGTPFRIGQTLEYWTPFISRENTRFIVETNKYK